MNGVHNRIFGGKYYAHSMRRGIVRYMGKLRYSHLIKRQKDTRILVILHLFYMDAWKEIREYLKNLSPYNYSLIVTCMEGCYDDDTLSSIKAFKPEAIIIKCENKGWDVLPFLISLHSITLSDYDIVFKLQSKGTKRHHTFLYNQFFIKRSWFLNLFEGCIGAFTVHTTIHNLIDKNQNIGLVAAKNLIVEDPIHKQHMVEETLKELGLPLPKSYLFVSGTCFAIRANLLEIIKELEFAPEKFNTNGFSFAHRMERIICFPPLWEGLQITGPEVLRIRRLQWLFSRYGWWGRKYNGVRVLKDPRVHVDDQFAFDCIEPSLIRDWEFINISLGEIRRQYSPQGECISLSETLPYKYIIKREKEIYQEYCEYNKRTWQNNQMSQQRFDELIDNLERNGNNNSNNIVIVDNNIIWDGQHRCCWLLSKYGEKHIINVLHCNRFRPHYPLLIQFIINLRRKIKNRTFY